MIPIYHKQTEDVVEHGNLWTTCLDCGAQWDACDEQVSEGDGSCHDEALREEER